MDKDIKEKKNPKYFNGCIFEIYLIVASSSQLKLSCYKIATNLNV